MPPARWSVLVACYTLVAPPAAASPAAGTVEFRGTCDASGAVPLDGHRFVVADDEDNVLRVYDAERGGEPVRGSTEVSGWLELPKGKKRWPETDIEAATGLGEVGLWLSSHGRKSSGKPDPSRLRFFGTRLAADGRIEPVGRPYAGLLEDLLAAPGLAGYGLRAAAAKAPKEPGGLNIEGMTTRLDGRSVVIGFRNPVPGGRAILVNLENPLEVLEGGRARLSGARLLDLGGGGIRALSTWRGAYLLVAGSTDGTGTSRLYRWDGEGEPERLAVDLAGLNAEAFVTFEDRDEILLLSDDGSRLVDGQECKRLKDAAAKRFRGRWVRLPVPVARDPGALPPTDVGGPWHP